MRPERRETPQNPGTTVDAPAGYAVKRLVVSVILMMIGACGMYVVPVVLPAVQAEFGVARADASLPYSLGMVGFGLGSLFMGRLADRFGVMVPVLIGAASLGIGLSLAAMAPNIWTYALAHAFVGFFGAAATFAPLIADTSLWWVRRRGIAVGVVASGNYLGGAIWPWTVQHFVETIGWRDTYFGIALFCFVTNTALALFLRRRPPTFTATRSKHDVDGSRARPFGLSSAQAQMLLCIAGVACCVAMSMPQVHIVAYCADLGYGVARGAEMLAVMLGAGIVSRLASGAICDRIGGVRTLILGSALQGIALLLFLPFDSLLSLYVIALLFGLFQGGIVPAYAIIIREHFSPDEAGMRGGLVIMCTLLGMALGGWLSGKVFDVTGSYHAAFVNGIAWNLLNLTIAFTLLRKTRRLQFA